VVAARNQIRSRPGEEAESCDEVRFPSALMLATLLMFAVFVAWSVKIIAAWA
jgi:hypothetical protein